MMSERERETSFLRRLIPYDGGDEGGKLEASLAQVLHDKRCMHNFAAVMALFPVLAAIAVAYETMLLGNFPNDGPHVGLRVLCELGLASLICLAAFGGLLLGYHKKLNRLRKECRQLATRLLEAHLEEVDLAALPGSERGPHDREASPGAAEVSGYAGSLASPSWLANRICG